MSLQRSIRATTLVATGLLLGGWLAVSPSQAIDDPGQEHHLIAVSEGSGVRPVDREIPEAALQLTTAYPDLRVSIWSHRVLLYGMPMTTGETPDKAVTRWMANHIDALGVEGPELVFDFVADLRFGGMERFGVRGKIVDAELVDKTRAKFTKMQANLARVARHGDRLDGFDAPVAIVATVIGRRLAAERRECVVGGVGRRCGVRGLGKLDDECVAIGTYLGDARR